MSEVFPLPELAIMNPLQYQVVLLGKCPFCRTKSLVDIRTSKEVKLQQCSKCLCLFATPPQ